jgi:branched-chain amino acid transport system permease protein
MGWGQFIQYVVYGVALGSLYSLIAIGYTIIYGIVGLINMAHGDFFMVAAYVAMWGILVWKLPMPASYALGAALAIALGVTAERIVYRPLRGAKISAFIGAIAVSSILQNTFVVFFSPRSKPFPHPAFLDRVLQFGEVALPVSMLFIIAASVLLFLILTYIVTKTKTGRAMRALSKDLEAAQLVGVNPDRVISFAFVLSTAFAAAGAFLWCSKVPYVDPFTGMMPGLKAFIAAVLGGIGSIPGALLGGFLLGLGEVMIVAALPMLTPFRDIFAYLILILFLLIRPGGLFNVTVREEKV